MKTTTFFKLLTIVLIFCAGKSFGQTYYNVYVDPLGTATLQPNVTAPSTIALDDEVIWTNTTTGTTYTKTGSSPNLTVNYADLTTGVNSYTVVIKSAALCLGDPSAAITIYKLPASTMTLSTPTVANYCTNASPAPSSVLVAEATPASALPAGISYTYTWTVTKTLNATTSTPASTTIGSHSVSSATPWKDTFTMNTTSVGSYNFSVKAVYTLASAASSSAAASVLKSGGYDTVLPSADNKDVVVSPKPTQPTITIL